jgi:hypothetical protein
MPIFAPAIEAGMREQLSEVEAVADNSEKPTFDSLGRSPKADASAAAAPNHPISG